ncbi:AcrR family transcriptional regulator [Azospirillum sp. OGB3]|uniref:TetR/AcrR family transcriptional regulator n=1 Tax=Azospirillum sp. OGB3 TaxID=2587012 RepID=UPI0016063045|nr:TetR/AcrR family transcriptional regulator [Azospirillum sp. OGB3]MBB3267043.1 AcrR family transcriptional regulator [Azospirillum sp. OGB3]
MGRLDNSARRAAIIDAALPLFARKGFAATTTKEIAQAAGVSEALIFKHFPSKAALYEAIFRSCVDGDEDLAKLLAMPPSTETLAAYVQAMVSCYACELPSERDTMLPRFRLYFMSLLEDGEFAHMVRRWMSEHIAPPFVASLRAARDAGDLIPSAPVTENAFWLAEMLGSTLATIHLPPTPLVPSLAEPRRTIRDAVAFILRGLGLREEAVALYTPLLHCTQSTEPEPTCSREADRDE